MVEVKTSVRFKRFTPAMLRMLVALQDLTRSNGGIVPDVLVITSANDSNHAKDSRHYTDEALDLRTHNFANAGCVARFVALLEKQLGPQFTVLLEDEGNENQHVHCQVRKGLTYVAT